MGAIEAQTHIAALGATLGRYVAPAAAASVQLPDGADSDAVRAKTVAIIDIEIAARVDRCFDRQKCRRRPARDRLPCRSAIRRAVEMLRCRICDPREHRPGVRIEDDERYSAVR